MIDSLTAAARLPQTDPDQAHAVAHAEGRATLALLRTLGSDDDWGRPTDCTELDVRALIAHLVAQCQDSLHLASMARRELLSRRRYPDKPPVDAYMAVGVDDHRAASGPSWSSGSRGCGPGPPAPAAAAQPSCAASRSTRAFPASPAGAWTTCWTSSTTATCGCTESTWPGPPGGRSSSATTTTRSSPRSSATWPVGGRRRRWRWS
jgi:hypothetical protein